MNESVVNVAGGIFGENRTQIYLKYVCKNMGWTLIDLEFNFDVILFPLMRFINK